MREFELQLIHGLQDMSCGFLDFLFEFFTFFGESLIAIAILAYFYWIYNKKEGQKLATVLITSLTCNNAIKGIAKVNRPFMDDETVINKRPSTATGYSFPSGHSQTASTLYASLMRFFKKRWLSILLSILIVLVMVSRMYLGAHYPTDVLVGCLLGLVFTFGLPKLIDKFKDQKWLLLSICLIFMPFAIYFLVVQNDLNDDFFKMYGLLLGYFGAYLFEKKYVNFTTDISNKKKVIRYIVGLVVLIALQGGLKLLFNAIFVEQTYILKTVLNLVRYGLISFVGLGLYPLIFTKLNF